MLKILSVHIQLVIQKRNKIPFRFMRVNLMFMCVRIRITFSPKVRLCMHALAQANVYCCLMLLPFVCVCVCVPE